MSAPLLVAIGGVFGSLYRYALGALLPSNAQGNLVANIIASAFAAHLLVLMERRGITQWRYILLPGFCGGLGTFSAITFDAVNILGSFLIGLTYALPDSWHWLIAVGFAGSFTTWSTFMLDLYLGIRLKRYLPVSINFLASVSVGLIAAWYGVSLVS